MRRGFGVLFTLVFLVSCGREENNSNLNALQENDFVTDAEFICVDDELCFQDIDGNAVVEGDIIIGETEDLLSRPQVRGATTLTSRTAAWAGNTVPYTFAAGFPENKKKWILDAAAHYAAVSHIKVIPRTTQVDYVEFLSNNTSGCSSYLGRRGGKQNINVGSCGGAGGIIHEIGHALGLYHEQSRPDRDQFIIVQFQNMSSGLASQYRIPTRNIGTAGTYDYRSVMHYSPFAGSINGKPTITKLDGTSTGIGSQGKLTSLDLEGIRKLYPNGAGPAPSPLPTVIPSPSPRPPTPSASPSPSPRPSVLPSPSPIPPPVSGAVGAPSNLKVSFTLFFTFFEFQDNSDNETAFEVEMKEEESGAWKNAGVIASIPNPVTGPRSFLLYISNSKPMTWVRVRAINSSHTSAYSNVLAVPKAK